MTWDENSDTRHQTRAVQVLKLFHFAYILSWLFVFFTASVTAKNGHAFIQLSQITA